MSIVIDSAVSVNYMGDMMNEFGAGDPPVLLHSFLESALPKYVADSSVFKTIDICTVSNNKALIERELPMGEYSKLNMLVPLEKNSHFDETNFTLFIQNVNVRSKVIVSRYMVTKPLVLKAVFALWDNKTGRPAMWGDVEARADDGVAVTIGTWEKLVERLAGQFFRVTPFYKQ